MICQINIKNLRISTIIGILDWEREKPQDIIINVSLRYDATTLLKTNNIVDAVDYGVIAHDITTYLDNNKFELVEEMASAIIELIMQNKYVIDVDIEIDKPTPLRAIADSVSIKMQAVR